MGKSGKSTLEERINETVFPHLFEGIEAKCHICGSGRKRNLRPRIYLIKNKFQAIFADGLTSYFLKLPNNVQYINVYDGKQPNNVWNLETSDDFVFIPNYGIVYGPATVLYWWDLHLFDYNEKIKVKVKYLSSGTYQPYAFDHVMEILSGFSAYDDDSFSVTVS